MARRTGRKGSRPTRRDAIAFPKVGYDRVRMGQVCAHCGQLHASYVMVCPTTGASVQRSRLTAITEDSVLVGSVLNDRYHVGDILGKGTTGTVFAAEHMSFSRGCALKVLRP